MTLATVDEIVDAELIATDDEKRTAIDGLAEYVEGVWPRVLHLIDIRSWELPEYTDFDDMWEKRIAPLGLSIGRAKERPEVVARMRAIGQRQKDVAEKLRVGLATVQRDDDKTSFDVLPAKFTDSLGRARLNKYQKKEKEKEMSPKPEHNSTLPAGHVLSRPDGKGAEIVVGDGGYAVSGTVRVSEALEFARDNPDMTGPDAARESGVGLRAIEAAYSALRKNGEIAGARNRLTEKFDSIAQGLTYVADDLANMTADLERATAEDLEFGREYFEDAMKKLNAFRKQLNAKY